MSTFIYDGSFQGLLCAVFQVYQRREKPTAICTKDRFKPGLFGSRHEVVTMEAEAARVLKKLRAKLSGRAIQNLYKTMLCEKENCEMEVYRFIVHCLGSQRNIESDYRNEAVLNVRKLAKQVDREVHRMHAFVRFQQTKDGLYVATIDPDFNVIPLIGEHFKNRYADQKWLIYDTRRGIGLYYDLERMECITLDNAQLDESGTVPRSVLTDKEIDFQHLWKSYFDHVNIPERKNMKLHIQHVPKRYWKYLSEK